MDKQITIRMPKELLAKWLSALRSGEYSQAKGIMRDSFGGYCCLGVLAQIAGDADEHEFDRGTPSRSFMEAHRIDFGDRGSNPWLPSLGREAADANDVGKTFAEIADAIEACAEGF